MQNNVKNLRLACLRLDEKESRDMSRKIIKYTNKDGKSLYKFQIYVGRRETTGTPIYVRKRGFEYYREAKEAYKEICDQIKKALTIARKENAIK